MTVHRCTDRVPKHETAIVIGVGASIFSAPALPARKRNGDAARENKPRGALPETKAAASAGLPFYPVSAEIYRALEAARFISMPLD